MKTTEEYENEIAELKEKITELRTITSKVSPILGALIKKTDITGTVVMDDAFYEKLLKVAKD